MKIEGKTVHILSRLDPNKYTKFVKQENGRSVLYVKLKKTLYGTIQAALLFWKNLTKTLKGWGFTINPYDWCVANKTVNGKQISVVWHVNDLKISHVDKEVVTHLIKQLDNVYGTDPSGNKTPLTIKRGKKHEYLGMLLDYETKGKVRIDMRQYICKILKELEHLKDGWEGNAITPATENLFKINNAAAKLNKTVSESFHHVVAQLLFLCK